MLTNTGMSVYETDVPVCEYFIMSGNGCVTISIVAFKTDRCSGIQCANE